MTPQGTAFQDKFFIKLGNEPEVLVFVFPLI